MRLYPAPCGGAWFNMNCWEAADTDQPMHSMMIMRGVSGTAALCGPASATEAASTDCALPLHYEGMVTTGL